MSRPLVRYRRRLHRPNRSDSADWLDADLAHQGFTIGAAAFALHMFVDFHLKIPALAMASVVVGAMALGRTAKTSAAPTSPPKRAVSLVLAALVALATAVDLCRRSACRCRRFVG